MDYVMVVLVQAGLTLLLDALEDYIPLSGYPITYVLVTMIAAYAFGLGPAVVSCLLGWLAFTYFFVPPEHTLWPIATSPKAWAQEVAFILGVVAVTIATVQARESRLRVQQLADESAALNESLRSEIAERTQTGEALRQSEERYRSLIDILPVAILLNRKNRFVFANQAAVDLLGASSPEDIIGKSPFDIFHSDYHEQVRQRIAKLLQGERAPLVEEEIVRMDGTLRVCEVAAKPIFDEGGIAIQVVLHDVTDRKLAEEALRASEAKYRTLFSTMGEGFCLCEIILDENGKPSDWRYLEANPAFGKNTGLDVGAAVGKTARELMPNIEPGWIETYGRVALTGQSVRYEETVGDLGRHFEAFAFCPAPGQFAVLFVDTTDRKNAEDEIRRLNTELEERVAQRTAQLGAANRELEAFSYSVSHDLRAPLRAIDGFSNALLKHYAEVLDDRGQDYLHRVRAAAQRMAQLIDDILGLSRATRAEMERRDVDVSEMALGILGSLRESQPERKAEVVVEPGMVANADSHLLRIALDNLLGNAWKFTSVREVARIEVGSLSDQQPGQGRVYYVRDNGAGFDPEYADRLFSPFQRLHSETEFAGTGIGLALVQRIVRRHGGRIWAEGAVDKGAAFYFTLGGPADDRL